MSLKRRLDSLRRQAGHRTSAEPDTDAESPQAPALADRLARLRSAGMQPPRPDRTRATAGEVADRVGGTIMADGVIVIERRIGLDSAHGAAALDRIHGDHGALPEAAGLDPSRAVFIDTETTGLSGGSGTAVFLLGMGRLDGGSLLVRQYLLTSFAGEGPMLEDATDWLADDDAFVSFNGKCFDVPLLTTRCRLAGLPDPFGERGHVDLLHPTRRAFGSVWDDCRLGTAERELLGFLRTDDLPGAEAPAAWFAYIHAGDGGRLPGVCRHNYWDIVSLAALLPAVAEAHAAPHGLGADVLAVARAAMKGGNEEGALRLLEAAPDRLGESGRLELARLLRRAGRWGEAAAIWEDMAARSIPALEHLAKYHEHVRRDYRTALLFAERLPPSVERDHRCRRLLEKSSEL